MKDERQRALAAGQVMSLVVSLKLEWILSRGWEEGWEEQVHGRMDALRSPCTSCIPCIPFISLFLLLRFSFLLVFFSDIETWPVNIIVIICLITFISLFQKLLLSFFLKIDVERYVLAGVR